MKKLLILSLVLFCGSVVADETISIAATSVPHAEILRQVKPILAKQHIDLQIKEFNDYVQPNVVVAQKQMDANFFQHKPYLEVFNQNSKVKLVPLVGVHIEPMGLYSDTKLAKFSASKNITDIPLKTKLAVPGDPSNENRALLLLQKNGLIKLKTGTALLTKKDIIANPRNLEIIEIQAGMLPRLLKSHQIGLAVINANYAVQANLNPIKDAVFLESKDSPYANFIVVRPEELKEPKMQALAKAVTSPEIKKFINTKYNGAVVADF